MDLSSWLRRALVKTHKSKPKSPTSTRIPINSKTRLQLKEDEEEELGVTDQLQLFLKSFTLETFKNFPLQDDDEITTTTTSTSNGSSLDSSVHTQKDLSQWQEKHAILVLSKVKEISHLRFILCPRHLKERQFWRIYFALVKSYVTPYEICAIQKAKLRRIGKKDDISVNTACEIEMGEAKGTVCLSPTF